MYGIQLQIGSYWTFASCTPSSLRTASYYRRTLQLIGFLLGEFDTFNYITYIHVVNRVDVYSRRPSYLTFKAPVLQRYAGTG